MYSVATFVHGRAVTQLPRSTIEQWGVLRAVVEEGGFAQAAEALNRSQSSVSYAVARLRDAVGVELLEQRGRRAVLTEAGAALLAQVAPLVDELKRVEQRGRSIGHGAPVRIRLLVDTLFPKTRLFTALQQFAALHPHAEVRLVETVRLTLQEVVGDSYDLAVLVIEPEAIDADRIADIRLLAVAAEGHPLLAGHRPVTKAMLARHVCAEIRGYDEVIDRSARQGRRWSMSTVESATDAVRHRLCYGWLPEHMIRDELKEGPLRALPLNGGSVRHVPLGLYRGQRLPGDDRATQELARLLASGSDEAGDQDDGNGHVGGEGRTER